MKRTALIMAMAISVVLVGCGDKEETAAEKREERVTKDDSFEEVVQSIDVNNPDNTSLNVKSAWEKLKGQEVKWEMEVVDIKAGRGGRVEIYAKKDGAPLYRGSYNIIAITYDTAKSEALKKGSSITVRGVFENKRQRKGHPMVLHIGSAQILD